MVSKPIPSIRRIRSRDVLPGRRFLAPLLVIAAVSSTHRKCAAFAPCPFITTPPKFQHGVASRRVGKQLDASRSQRKRRICSSPILFASPAKDEEVEKIHYIRPYLKQLFLLCRPSNIPVVALFHLLGVHQAVQLWGSTSSAAAPSSLLLPVLKHPSMLMVLLSLLLVTSTSMITNDYYDARNGVDSSPDDDADNENDDYHPLARGEIPFSVTKMFDSYLYAMLLLSSAFVPGVVSRLLVLGGAIITYLYTVHLKPKTWVKNLSCAALVAMSPVTSGLAAWHVLCEGPFLNGMGAGVGVAAVSTMPFSLIFGSPLSYLVVALFAGIMSREILMDITDCDGDARAGIETLPVRYGKNVAARVAMGCSVISGIAACGASFIPLIRGLGGGGISLGNLIAVPTLSSLTALFTNTEARKALLSVVGSGMLIQRTFSVLRTRGEDANLADRAIRESLISVLVVLASFG